MFIQETVSPATSSARTVTGIEPHGLGSGTIGMIKARIAKAVVERKPALVAPENRDEFLKIVEDIYSSDAQKWCSASETDFNDLMQKEWNRRLRELSASTIEASTGPEFEDDEWYEGLGKAEDDEIERNLEAPFDGGDWYDEVYTEK
jgi:hypothetical protein